MQISGLTASGTFSATDVLAIEVNVNGTNKTYKLTGATLAAALASIGSYLTTADTAYDIQSLTINASYVRGAGQSIKFGCFVLVKFQATVTSQLGPEVFATVPASHIPTSEVYPIVAKYTNASGEANYYTNYINISASGTIQQGITGSMAIGSQIEATYLYKLG